MVRLSKDGDQRELVMLRWGLVPSWSKGPDSRYSMINARAETVATKPAFFSAFEIPAPIPRVSPVTNAERADSFTWTFMGKSLAA